MKKWILCAVLLLVLWLWWGNTALEVNKYTITSSEIPASFDGFRIAQVSDLHNAELGDGNERLLALLEEEDPDLIVITGDIVDSRNTDIEVAIDFARAAAQIAPAYYVTGNHESRIGAWEDLKAGLTEAGVTVLENEKVSLERDRGTVTLLGIDDPTFRTGGPGETLADLTAGEEGFTILLSHRPELFETYVSAGMDLVFSGHAHGGQVRLPFVGGLVAPNQGFFPEYDCGLYTEGTTHMLVSRGIGNSIIPLRINNRPEIVIVDICSGFSGEI